MMDYDFSSFGMQRTSEKMNLTLPNLISDDYLLSAEIETSGTVTKFANYAGFTLIPSDLASNSQGGISMVFVDKHTAGG